MVRAPFYDKNGLKKGAWSSEEDEKLRSYIQRFGHWNWRELPKFAGLERCGKSCRLRWMNYLRPDVKHGNFTEEEDALIIRLHQQHGNRWSIIAASLPGRTDNEIKNHWHTSLKSRANGNSASSTTDSPISESHCTTTSECEVESLVIDISPNMILESSQYFSPSTSSNVEFSTFSPVQSDYTSNSLNVSAAIEDPNFLPSSSLERYEDHESGGDFWSEPFVGDNVYNQDGLIDMPLNYDTNYDDNSADLQFYQRIQGWGLD